MMIINDKGQSLVEAMLALGVAAIIIGSIALVVLTTVNNADYSKTQNLATQYAQQALDIVRQQSDSNWSAFSAYVSGTYCLAENSTDLGSPTGGCSTPNITSNNNNFIRSVVINTADASCGSGEKVTVSVSWPDSKCTGSNKYCENVTLDSCFAQIANPPNP